MDTGSIETSKIFSIVGKFGLSPSEKLRNYLWVGFLGIFGPIVGVYILVSSESSWTADDTVILIFLVVAPICLAAFFVYASNIYTEISSRRIQRVFPTGKIVSIDRDSVTSATITRDRYGNYGLLLSTAIGDHHFPISKSLRESLDDA